jgi:ubiquinone biosynthesis monooxygenase Coq7
MRVNHAGEVCAQALYLGQAAVAKQASLRAGLLSAAAEEADHLAWCAERLAALNAAPSVLGMLWFGASFAIGAVAGLAGDATSLGFIVETERQVEAHLGQHLERLPPEDQRSRAVLSQMQLDEARHGEHARDAGAGELPPPVPRLMAATAAVMKWLAYRI